MLVGVNGVEIQCRCCHKELDEPGTIIKYDGNFFCSDDCLGAYLVEQVEEDIELVRIDTKENMKMCAEESKNEW